MSIIHANAPDALPVGTVADFCANLTVEDASCPGQAKLSRGVEFIMFSRRPENLPQPSDCWKVLRMQQVTVRRGDCYFYARCTIVWFINCLRMQPAMLMTYKLHSFVCSRWR